MIVDDEPIARRVLAEALELVQDVEVIGEADTGVEAVKAIAELKPDVVFLDLHMPGMDGFEVVRSLERGTHVPVIIMVTAFDQHAIRAFEAGAVDYLLKPVGCERLEVALDRARRLKSSSGNTAEQLAKLQEIADGRPGSAQTRKIVGRAGEEYILLNPEEVYAFQADGDVVWILTATKKYLASQPLRVLQNRLGDTNFRRVHRNALVNMDHVRKMSTLSSQRWLITLANNLEFIVSKRLVRNIRHLLTW